MKTSKLVSVGLAMFAMLFGAGNVVFPLILGRSAGNQLIYGLIGFVLTAVIVPLLGLVSTMLCGGQYKNFLGKLGKIPGALIAFICMILIGPFALTARCITISHASIVPYFPYFTLFRYSIFTAIVILLFTIKRNAVIDILGKVLGPLKLILLSSVVIKGLMHPAELAVVATGSWNMFLEGIHTGYGTADLLGTVFFSGLILSGLKKGMKDDELTPQKLASMGLKAGAFGAILLGVMYTGFFIVAAFYGQGLAGVARGDVFSALARLVLGGAGGWLANMTVAISTITTAIALNVVFASYLSDEVFAGKLAYHPALIASITITAIMSNLGFSGIMTLVMPVISVIYPALIVLALVNMAQVLYGFKWVKAPVFATLGVTVAMQYGPAVLALIK